MPQPKVLEKINTKDPFGDARKQKSREAIWKGFARHIHAPLATALLMPGSTRYELDVALACGFRLEQLFLVEKNPAVLANFTRRHSPHKEYYGKALPPLSNFLRMYLSQASTELLRRNIRLDVAHIDFCSHCEAGEMITEIHQFVHSGVLKDESYLAITFLAGREHKVEQLVLDGAQFEVSHYDERGSPLNVFQGFSDSDRGRIRHIWEAIGFSVTIRQFGRYQNERTNNPLIWLLLHCKTKNQDQKALT